jgi:hypothetical protein
MERNEHDSCADALMRSLRLSFMLSFAHTLCSFALVGDRGRFVAILCSGVAAAIVLTRTWTRTTERKDHAPTQSPPATRSAVSGMTRIW